MFFSKKYNVFQLRFTGVLCNNIYSGLHLIHKEFSAIENQSLFRILLPQPHWFADIESYEWFIHTGDSLFEFVVKTFDTIRFFKGVFLVFPDDASASAASSWSIIVMRFFNSFPRSPEISWENALINDKIK